MYHVFLLPDRNGIIASVSAWSTESLFEKAILVHLCEEQGNEREERKPIQVVLPSGHHSEGQVWSQGSEHPYNVQGLSLGAVSPLPW